MPLYLSKKNFSGTFMHNVDMLALCLRKKYIFFTIANAFLIKVIFLLLLIL